MTNQRIFNVLLYLFCMVVTIDSFAQSTNRRRANRNNEEVLFYDSFDRSSSKWWTGNSSTKRVSIYNGKYTCKNLKDPVQYCTTSINLDQSRDFYIEGRLAYKAGTSGYGIIFGRKNDNTSWRFIATDRDGQYFIRKMSYGTKTAIQSWASSSSIRQNNQMNTFRIEKKGSSLKFYANGALLKSTTFSRFTGNQYGFFCGNNSTIEAEYFKVAYTDSRGSRPVTQTVTNNNTNTRYNNTTNNNNTTRYNNTTTNTTTTTTTTVRKDYSNGPEIEVREPELSRGFKTVREQELRVAGFANSHSDLREVTINGVSAYLGPEHYFSANVPVRSGANTITVTAMDSNYKTKTKTFRITVN